jgi:hypothetical protein
LFSAVLLFAFLAALLGGGITHARLRPQLELRGVSPWRLGDSLAASPLILIGSAGVGAGLSMSVLGLTGFMMTIEFPRIAVLGVGLALLAVSAFIITLGVIALRKLR